MYERLCFCNCVLTWKLLSARLSLNVMMASPRSLVSVLLGAALLTIMYVLFLEAPQGSTRTVRSDKPSDSSHSLQSKHERTDVKSLSSSPSHGAEEDGPHRSDVDIAELVEKINRLENELKDFKASVGVSCMRQGKGPPNQINTESRKIDVKKLPRHEQVRTAIC